MSDETWDKLVKRSRIIYSVIHFTSPCSECKLPQSFYFKPSFPSRGCRLPSLLPIRLAFLARCPGGNCTPWDKECLCFLPLASRWPAALWFYHSLKNTNSKTHVFFYSLYTWRTTNSVSAHTRTYLDRLGPFNVFFLLFVYWNNSTIIWALITNSLCT